MPVIFISYRRSDSQDVTGRIYAYLAEKFSAKQVFMDVDNIPLGVSFPMHIKQLLTKANLTLVIIGPTWLTATDKSGNRRLDDPKDYVRMEVETALKASMPVIPVLVGNAPMPTMEELPPSLRKLMERNGVFVRPEPHFDADLARLIAGIEHVEMLLNPSASKSARKEKDRALPAKREEPAIGDELTGITTLAPAYPVIRREPKRLPKWPFAVAGAIVALLVCSGLLAWLVNSWRPTDPDKKQVKNPPGEIKKLKKDPAPKTPNTSLTLPPEYQRRGTLSLKEIESLGGSAASEAAVANGLKWIIRQQMPDGSWQLDSSNLPEKDRASQSNEVAATALALLPLLAAGHSTVPSARNEYDKQVDKGLKFLVRSQDKQTGYFGGAMYAHALATIAMCEAYGQSNDPAFRQSAQSATDLIIQAQGKDGGWRYTPTPADQGDVSVLGWQVAALMSAKASGLQVPAATITRARTFLDSCCNSADEGYSYVAGAKSTARLTAMGLYCRQRIDNWGIAHPRSSKAIQNFLKKSPPDKQDAIYTYYATQVMFNLGGDDWRQWNDTMREYLVKNQDANDKSANFGSWAPAGDPYGKEGGRLFVTSLHVLTLQVYYRYPPRFWS